VQEFLDEYEGFHPDVLGLIRAAPADTLIKWGLFIRPPIKVWTRGRVALLGDSAHPILPFLGLGAALAIEDSVVLARALDATPDVEQAFAAYQAARMARVEQVRVQTIRQGEIIQSSDPDREDVAKSPSQDVRLFDYDPSVVMLRNPT
jgi:salicylate hydroxylase